MPSYCFNHPSYCLATLYYCSILFLTTIIFINFNIFTTSGLKLDLSTATPAQLTPHTIEFTACPSHSDNPMVDVEWTKNSLLHSSKFEEEKEETI
jgi:hypothetical protein